MFDKVHRALARGHDPAVDVWIALTAIYAPWVEPSRRAPVPLVQSEGLTIPARVPGVLHAWLRAREGAWLGLVSYSITSESDVGSIRMRHLVPQTAVTRRWPVGEEPF